MAEEAHFKFWSSWIENAEAMLPSDPDVLRLCWNAGGKYDLLQRVYEVIPEHTTFIEEFGGTYQVILNKTPSKIEIVNDKDPCLTALAYCFLFCPDDLYKAARLDINSQGLVDLLTEIDFPNNKLIELSLRKLYLVYHTFGSKELSFAYNLNGGNRYFIKHSKKSIDAIRDRLAHIHIFNEDFKKNLDRMKKVTNGVIFADPPYTRSLIDDVYTYNFTKTDHSQLWWRLKRFKPEKVKVVVTYDDNPEIEKKYRDSGFHVQKVQVRQFLNNEKESYRTELLMTNFKPEGEVDPEPKAKTGSLTDWLK